MLVLGLFAVGLLLTMASGVIDARRHPRTPVRLVGTAGNGRPR